MNPEEAARFYNNFIDVPPSRLWCQVATDMAVFCAPVSESMQAAAAVALVSGIAPSASGYEENPSAGMLLEKFVDLAASMRSGYLGEPVEIAINGRGQLVITNGIHRTALALALGLPLIPARVVYRSEEWQTCKRVLHAINGGPRLYQPVDHPDLSAWPVWRVDTGARARIMGEAAQGGRRGVDLACHTGGMTLALARHGFNMDGFDTDPKAIHVASFLRDVPDVGSPLAGFSVCDPIVNLPHGGIDFVVCLSLLNHHQEDRDRWEEGAEIFRRCEAAAPLVFLDCPAPGDPVGGASEFVDPEAVFRWCAQTGASGVGSVLALRGENGLQRTLLAWRSPR